MTGSSSESGRGVPDRHVASRWAIAEERYQPRREETAVRKTADGPAQQRDQLGGYSLAFPFAAHSRVAEATKVQPARSHRKRPALRAMMVFGGLAALSLAGMQTTLTTAHAAPRSGIRQGLYVQGSWLCRRFSSGTIHCTHHWHRDRQGRLISDNPSWVPNASYAPRAQAAQAPARVTFSHAPAVVYHGSSLAPEPCSPNVPSSVWTTVNYRRAWTVPPGCYGGVFHVNPSNYVHRSGFGWCNWWPEVLRPDEPQLPWGAGLARGKAPRVGATVYFAPFDQGASAGGHYGHVESISPDGGYILISEMNDIWRGAGFAKVNYRYVRVDGGLTFIY